MSFKICLIPSLATFIFVETSILVLFGAVCSNSLLHISHLCLCDFMPKPHNLVPYHCTKCKDNGSLWWRFGLLSITPLGHRVCRTCIFHYLADNKYCPICEVQVHKTKPLVNVRPDKTMQALVYKLVPGLQKEEMRRRQEFYSRNSEHNNTTLPSSAEDGVISTVDHRVSSQLDRRDCISICLELCDRLPPVTKTGVHHESIVQKFVRVVNDRRYLFCPASMTVGHLKRFLRCKLDLPPSINIDIFHSNVTLQELYTLWDIANIYTWRRTEPLKLYYVMYSTSEPSSTKSTCTVGIVSCREYLRQRQENLDVTDKLVEEEQMKRSVNVSCQSVDSGNIIMNRLVSVSVCDTANIDFSDRVQSRLVCCSELYEDKFGTEKTDTAAADIRADALECDTVKQIADVSSSTLTPYTEASSEFGNDGTVKSVVNNDNNESVVHLDDLSQNDTVVSPELTSEEKIGFEPDAISVTDQWPATSPVVERRVRRLQTEVQRLLFDTNGSGMKRELRTAGRHIGGVRRKTRRSPLLRLRTIVSLRPSSSGRHPNRQSGRDDSKRN